MLPSNTVFVVGAGASNEVRLPIASGLKAIIAEKLSFEVNDFGGDIKKGDRSIFNALMRKSRDQINAYIDASRRISQGVVLAQSIDDFIDAHQHDALIAQCGKLAIAKSILEAEAASALAYDTSNIYNTMNFATIENTWYVAFFRLLTQQVSRQKVEGLLKNVTIICFNYDRCIEHFLVHAVAGHYQMPREEARDLVQSTLKIFHPYGVVGSYFEPTGQVEFGLKGLPDFDRVMRSLRTYSEQTQDGDELTAIRNAVSVAETLVFLGMAYHPNNMALLTLGNTNKERKKIYATRKGISNEDLRVVKQRLLKTYRSGRAEPNDPMEYGFAPTCSELFRDFHMSMRE